MCSQSRLCKYESRALLATKRRKKNGEIRIDYEKIL